MSTYNGVEIAIIGMTGQFPGADNVQEFWNNLVKEEESISFLTEVELMEEGASPDYIRSPSYVRANAYMRNKEYFDAEFFGYRPEEAKLMDPQLRLFHENCWKVLEDAGYGTLNKDNNKIGLFAGASSNNNWENYSILSNWEKNVDEYTASQLRDTVFLCSRVSYLLDLQGPSVFINTACSTSLVAIQRACMSLLMRECNMAIAGGVSVNNYSRRGYLYQEGMISSRDGHCRPFDAQADGTVGGEGIGLVLLKRLSDAIKDRDNIYAVIRGGAINNDGYQKMSFTSPSVEGQYKTIAKSIAMARIPAESISYVEAHGTGTKLGDPIEVEALNRAFGKSESKYCALGSVKSNIGHLDAAAGVAGLIKTVLSLQHRQLPASLHYREANPKIDFAGGPFYVNTELKEWKHAGYPLRAGVSSFGIGGTNAHVILEEAPAMAASSGSRTYSLLPVSGKTPGALMRNTENLLNWLRTNPGANLHDVAYTLQIGRSAFGYRGVVVCRDVPDAIGKLSGLLGASVPPATFREPLSEKSRPMVAFLFPGQGAQYIDMCRKLYEQEETFRKEADHCFELLLQGWGKDLRAHIFPSLTSQQSDAASAEQELNNTSVTQPALFVMEYALARLLLSWGIQPDVLVGHSIGEYVAACLGGLFTLEDALGLVVKRGELMERTPVASMLAVELGEEPLRELLAAHPELSLSAVNSTSRCVVSGRETAVEAFRQELEAAGHQGRLLRVSRAFHSDLMDGVLEEFGKEVAKIKMGALKIPFLSNLTGRMAVESEVSKAKYWVDHLRGTVQFSSNIEVLCQNREVVFVEVGPGRSLSSLVRSHQGFGEGHKAVSLVRHALGEESDEEVLQKGIGQLWETGVMPSWEGMHAGDDRRRISLPGYSFEREEYPVLVDAFRMIGDMLSSAGSSRRRDLPDWFYVPGWQYSPLPIKEPNDQQPDALRTLLLSDGDMVNTQLAQRLRGQGETVIEVRMGASFKELSMGVYELDPGQGGQYMQLWKALTEKGMVPDRIIHGWSLSAAPVVDTCFYSLVYLIRTMHDHEGLGDKEIVVLTSDMQVILGGEEGSPYQGLNGGLLKVLSQEYPAIVTSHIDISAVTDNNPIDKLIGELAVVKAGKTVAYRNGRRWQQQYEPLRIDTRATPNPFRQSGVYVITGGLGKLGRQLSHRLLSQYDARVLLLGRTVLPELQELSTAGGEVLYISCDISDKESLRCAIEQAESRWGRIDGVIHAAGITTGGSIDPLRPIHELQREDYEEQFAPKIKGLEALREVLEGKELDFCLLTSSLSAVLGGLGFGAYAPANSYMDHYIRKYKDRDQLKNWVSVNLDGLNFTPGSTDAHSLNAEELQEVLERVLTLRHLSQVVVSKTDLQDRLDAWVYRTGTGGRPRSTENPGANRLTDHGNTPATGPGGELTTSAESILLQLWCDFFGKGSIGLDADFFEIGGDSLKALTMIGRIYKRLGVQVSVTEFFRRPTVRKLGEYISAINKGSISVQQGLPAIPRAAAADHYRLSPAQKRLYLMHNLGEDYAPGHLTSLYNIKGRIDKKALDNACFTIINSHESLRSRFIVTEETIVRQITGEIPVTIEEIKLSGSPLSGSLQDAIDDFTRPFDLSIDPLCRIGLVDIKEDEHILVIDIHPIVSDNASIDILFRQIMAFYHDGKMPKRSPSYGQYLEWHDGVHLRQEIDSQRKFWLQEFANEPERLDFPADYPKPLLPKHKEENVGFDISKQQLDELRTLAKNNDVDTAMILQAVFCVLSARLCGQEQLTIGMPVTGRLQGEWNDVVGPLENLLAVRLNPRKELRFSDFLSQLKTKLSSCLANSDYPYTELMDQLEPHPSRHLFDIMYTYRPCREYDHPALQLETCPVFPAAIFLSNLHLQAAETSDGRILLQLTYSPERFNRKTVERYAAWFLEMLSSVLTAPQRFLWEISPSIETPDDKGDDISRNDRNTIEMLLRSNDRVKDVAVFTHDFGNKGKFLIAFIVPSGIISVHKLKEYAGAMLPGRLVPDYILKCNEIPLTADGRKNWLLLANMAYTQAIGPDLYIEPKGKTERQITQIWREVTGAGKVSRNDTFFDIGGRPDHLMTVSRIISSHFDLELPPAFYYTHTLREMAARLTKETALLDEIINPVK